MPAKEAVRRQRLIVVLRRVQHHLDDAFDVTVRRLQPADFDSEPTRDRRAYLVCVQPLAFDLAALQHVFGERAENGLLSDPEAERLHLADQSPLQVPACRQRGRQPSVIPAELGPVRSSWIYVAIHRTSCGDYTLIRPNWRTITARNAANIGPNHRRQVGCGGQAEVDTDHRSSCCTRRSTLRCSLSPMTISEDPKKRARSTIAKKRTGFSFRERQTALEPLRIRYPLLGRHTRSPRAPVHG